MPQSPPNSASDLDVWPDTRSCHNADFEETNAQPSNVAILVEKELLWFIEQQEKVVWIESVAFFPIGQLDRQLGAEARNARISVWLKENDAFNEWKLPAMIRHGRWSRPNVGERENKHSSIKDIGVGRRQQSEC
ncbi:hypothetical protein [Luteimonas sp. MC1825]|uniref:hypothetical protein n=1 Tax=Luteimonas sp. MC1825 TaxID=2761107 RepID=UPI00168B76CB|nr:hypothetical protein [Luteimonas sp. MC1825]QOC88227.1 hypothetical protein IDM46_00130 [Luteimonas sp. MC1825]